MICLNTFYYPEKILNFWWQNTATKCALAAPSLANIKRFVDWTHSWVSYLLLRADENHIYAIKLQSPSFFSQSTVWSSATKLLLLSERHLLDDLGWFFTHVFGTHCAQPQLENLVQKSHPKIFINSQPSIFLTGECFLRSGAVLLI